MLRLCLAVLSTVRVFGLRPAYDIHQDLTSAFINNILEEPAPAHDTESFSTTLRNTDFKTGTYLIQTPGTYTVEEDIVFNPETPLASGISDADVSFPDPSSEKYPQLGGFFLGFFATIAVVADDVTIDCQGHSIAMSHEFHTRQRFHSIIELGSKPFISGAGPPQFSKERFNPSDPTFPDNVVIKNCVLGLSSHHGIHGNNNRGIKVQNVTIRDFEVGGIHLNGAHDVLIENVDIGPSLKQTFSARLSQAIFLDHLMNTLLPTQPHLSDLRDIAKVSLGGREEETVGEVFKRLHDALQVFFASRSGPLQPIVGDGMALPDGSAVYGIVIHTTGPAVKDFGACPLFKAQAASKMVSGLSLKHVSVHDLALDVDQVTRLIFEGNQVMGPAGDVFDWRISTDSDDRYIGNILSDAQLTVGAFKKFLQAHEGLDQDDLAALGWYFGAVHIPDSILTWAGSGEAWSGPRDFSCDGDAMSHANKGAVGLFLSYLLDGTFENVTVSNLSNLGKVDTSSERCVKVGYRGGDTRGVAIVNSPMVTPEGISVWNLAAGPGGVVKDVDIMRT